MRALRWTAAGSVLSAAASSACCWLPLLAIATGFSAAGAAAFFERFRVLFLVVASVLLGLGFYLNHRPEPERCGPDGSCVMPNRKLRRINRGMLWFSAALVALFALFPNYVGNLLATAGTAEPKMETSERLVLGIEGMTCAGCEAGVAASLAELPGVRQVSASFVDGEAIVEVDADAVPEQMALAAAVARAGYELTSMVQGAAGTLVPSLAGQWVADLSTENEGETTQIVVDLGQLEDRWVGEFDLMDYRVENYPVEVSLSGDEVTLFLTSMGMEFKGSVSADGKALSGVGVSNDDEEAIEFTRSHDVPQFSEGFLKLEAAADDPVLVERLSPGATELRDRFNADKDDARLIVLLSPT